MKVLLLFVCVVTLSFGAPQINQDSFARSLQEEIQAIQKTDVPANIDTTTGGVREVIITSNDPVIPSEFGNIFNQLRSLFNLNEPNIKWVFRFTNSTTTDAGNSQWNSKWRATWVHNPNNTYTLVINP